ncbi:MAG TPA: amino acid adenylation domain-containing protein, partial [Pyrinomonadaceae bacterium]
MSAHSVTNRQPSTLIELLRHRALCQAQQEAYTFLLDDESEEARLTYEELDARARAIAAWLQSIVANGDRVLLLYPPGLDYIAAFFGCLYAGAIAVPAYPPKRNRSLLRLQAIVSDAKAGVALTTGALLSRIVPLFSQNPYLEPLRWLATDKLEAGSEKDWQEPAISGEDLAFFQYTSGSTGAPKGVMLTHANLLHNAALIYKACGHTPADRYVSWLPTFHDMGFMAGILQPLYGGFPVTGMSPASFLQRPLRWLKAISKYRATTSGGPNFAYDLCTRKITPEQRATLDLSSWKVAFNGAEPIRRDTLERFTESFAPCGFRPSTFYPCYGLAEATLMVTGSRPASAPLVKVIEAGALEKNLVVEAGAGSVDVRAMIGCGRTLEGQQVIIVNTESLTECPPGEVGEIWVSGPSVAQGYWNRPEETEATFRARLAGQKEGFYLRTGDLGFLDDGELFVTGRFKDLIIIRGLNHYPQDIELSVEQCHPALRRGCGAAFSIEVAGEEQLVIVQEVEVRQKPDFDALIGAIQHALALEHELQAFAVVLVRPGTIPKTSSGKIQRHACRAGFIQTTLDVVAEWRRPFIAEPETTDSAAPPAPALESTGEVEEWLRSELAARLKLAPSHIESDEPITHYGLDSLTAVELTQSIEAAFGVNLPVAAILQSWSIESLAAYLFSQAVSAGNAPRRALIAAQEREAEHPLSYGQQALWFLHQLEPQSSAYNIARAVRIEAELDSEALRRSFQTLVDRHASLRTTFHAPRGEPFQRIHEYMEVCFQEEDGASWDASFLDERLVWEAHRPFDLEHGPLLRVHIFTRGPSDHFLLLVVHHIVADFWSLTLLAHELGILYRAEKERRPASLPPLSLQYTDYVRWQKEMLNGAAGEKDWSYWQEQLKDVSWLNLPVDRPRPRAQSYEGASLSFRLSEALTAELKMIGRAQGATLYMLLLAAFKLLLHRYSGQEDIVVGTPTAGRGWAALSALVGYFVNPVVMRARLSGNPTFKELLGHVRQVVLEAFEHIDYPFALLVQRLQVERDPSRNTLFQVMFVLQKAHLPGDDGLASFALGEAGARHSLGGLPLESVALQGRAAQFDLTLMMAEVEGGLAASLEYSTELYEAATVERMARHFTLLLEQIARDPGLPVSRLQFLSAEEQRQLLFDWNQTLRLYPAIECLHHTFEAQARLTPSRVAVRDGEQSLSYGELNRRSNQLAQHLRALGLGAESPVAVIWKRTVEMVVCLLAVLKAGAAYVPLDPSYPRDRLRLMIEDSGAELVLAEAEFARVLDEVAVPLISPDRMWNELAGLDDENPQSRAGRENLAYVIYTSGSTGRPKGVAIEHKSSVNFVQWAIEEFTAETLSAVLASTSICFDLSVFEIFAPLACGGQVLMAENALDLGRLAGGESVRLINTVPSAASALLRLKAVPQSVRVMNLAGEPLRRSLVDEIYSSTQVEEVNNLYGPTEYTTYTTRARVERGSQREPAIGRAIANTELYILDEEQQVVAVGVCGEIYVGGAGLARCYVGRPEQTAASFVPHPFGSRGGERLYRTGDVARYRADGEIEYVGRKDEQVKVRGYRIEPGEVESILLEEEGVKECVVALREDAGGDKRLVAYVVGADGRGPSAAELRLSLKERVPDYMLPSAFVQLEALPLTPNGKLDRRALPAPEESGFEQETAVAARTPIEEIVAGIWSELLGLSRVGSDANFFELGGHSLLAVQVISRLRHLFHLELPLRALFEEPTVSGLSRKIAMAEHLTPVADFLPISRAEREKPLPLSFAQQRLWFLNQLERDSAFYNMPAVLRLKGYLQGDVLARSLREIVRRHEVLRTTFRFVDEEPRQVIAPEPDIPLVKMSLCDIEEPEARELRARALSIREAREPFDLAHGPLVRLTLLQLGEQEHWLLLTMHHIVCDEWSIRILMRELATLYTAYAAGRESPLEELPVQYADYAVWQREWLQGETLERQLSYWKQQLAGAPLVLELPTDRPRPPIQTHRGRSASFELAADLSLKLRGLGHREGVTPFMLLLSAFAALLYRYTGQAEIVVGTPYANRNRREVESLIGCFVNTLALPLKMSGAQGFAELLDEVRELALDAHAHQDVAFEKLVEELQPTRDLSRQPLFQVMFALQSAPDPRVELPGLNVNLLETDTETAKFDLTFALALRAEGIGGAVEYSTDLYDAATVERMIGHFRSLLEAIAADPKQPLSTLALLTKAEREQLLVEWNETAADYRACALHELFERQAKATPRAAALIYGDEQLSYGELNERAGRLSHYLSSLGVRAGARVGICVSRSMEMIVGLLGILKTGCTYLPLDPDNPRERLSFIIEDAQAHLILTETGLREKLPGLSPRIVNLEEIALDCPAAWDENRPALPAESPAYLIYTSGSTGRPKGVLVSHAAISNHLQWMAEEFPLSTGDRVLQKYSISFDASVVEIFHPLMSGACLVIVEPGRQHDIAHLVELMIKQRVTAIDVVPTMLKFLLEEERLAECQSLRRVACGGESLEAQLVARFYQRLEGVELSNLYGPTEATVGATFYKLSRPAAVPGVAIGRPIANSQLYILDRYQEPVPVGVAGEIYIGGKGLALGYWNQPRSTAEKFIPDPFGKEDGARLYRTGDRGRYWPDGNVEFLGRSDYQVKIRGYRIEVEEIEAALRRHPAIREAVVMATRNERGDQQLTGYLVPDGPGPTGGELRQWLENSLPGFMIPASFTVTDELPLTPNGKVDRQALRDIAPRRAEALESALGPRSTEEELLITICSELLGVRNVSPSDNFFGLGGHSLLATQLLARIRQVFGVELPLRALFESSSLADLARRIKHSMMEERGLRIPPLGPRSRRASRQSQGEQLLPLSFAQQRLWFLEQLTPGTSAYNIATVIRLAGRLDQSALLRGLNEIVSRHESLRTSFHLKAGEPVQAITEGLKIEMGFVSLAALPREERERAWRRMAAEEARKPFDLQRAPLLRASLLEIERDEHLLFVTMHHIVSDGWSLTIFARELASTYEAYRRGAQSPLSPLKLQYPDYAEWQRQWLTAELLDEQLRYWRSQLSDLQPMHLPTDHPRSAVLSYEGASYEVELSRELTDALREQSLREGATLYMTLLSAFSVLLRRMSGGSEAVIGTVV